MKADVRVSRNSLLSCLPLEASAKLWPHLERVDLPLDRVIVAVGHPIEAVYFPLTGVVSVVERLAVDGKSQVGMVGPEGLVGAWLTPEHSLSPVEAVVHRAGAFVRLEADVYRRALANVPSFSLIVCRYSRSLPRYGIDMARH